MRVKQWLTAVRDNYVIRQAARVRLPDFEAEEPVRLRVLFSGRVQHVGFRLEVCELARRLELTGFCENLKTGQVLAEFQGGESRIRQLISVMESLVRIRIRQKEVTRLPVVPEEAEFRKR